MLLPNLQCCSYLTLHNIINNWDINKLKRRPSWPGVGK